MLYFYGKRAQTLESDDVSLYTGTYYLYHLICMSLQFIYKIGLIILHFY